MHKYMFLLLPLCALIALVAACGQSSDATTHAPAKMPQPATNTDAAPQSAVKQTEPVEADAGAILAASVEARNGVGLNRLQQTAMQKACSNANDDPGAQGAALQTAAQAAIEYPAEGNFLGDWENGEKIAQNGKGMQYSDDPSQPNGGNCYACHQLGQDKLAYGTIGPSLANYGARGQSEAVLKYTWGKIWNPQATVACSHMPRFGDAGILTADQIRDVMALLLDPASPVNHK